MVFWICLLTVAVSRCFGGNPLKAPRRVVEGQTVDLGPLFHWWTNHSGSRPLTAWVHLTGSIVGTNTYGWTLEAHVESSGEAGEKNSSVKSAGGRTRVILKNPPRQDQADFENLAQQLKELTGQHQRLSAQETADKGRESNISSQRRGRSRSRALAQEKQVVSQEESQLKSLDKEIQEVRAKLASYPNSETYVVDCLALETGHEHAGVLMYDHGVVLP
jgi:hypothetical protein